MGMPLWKVSGFLRHLILTPVSCHTSSARHCHGHASLKCFTLVSLLPSDSCPGLHDRHHFQVHSGQSTMLWEVCLMGDRASLGWQVLCMGEVEVLQSYVAYASGLSLSFPSVCIKPTPSSSQ